MLKGLVFLAWHFLFCHASLFIYEDDFEHKAYMDEEETYLLYWNNLNDTHIEFGLTVEATGWIALGISPNGQMPDSDIALAWVDDSDGTVYLEDRFAYGRDTPALDEEQNLVLIEGSQVDGYTYLRFVREKYPCEREEDVPVSDGTTRVLYAYNPDNRDPDPLDVDGSIEWHEEKKGSKSVNLISGDSIWSPEDLPDDAVSFDLLAGDYLVPTDDTTYYCILLKLPETLEKQHIIAYEPIIQEGNEGVVHHFIVDFCNPLLVEEENVGRNGTCNDYANMDFEAASCYGGGVIAGWAVGGKGAMYPDHVGFEMSGVADGLTHDTLQYVVLSIHYDNPHGVSGIVDNSGMRIWYTPSIRENSAELISVGVVVNKKHFIPGGMASAVNYGACNSECTSLGFPEGGVNIISSTLHSHTMGVSMRLHHIRDGIELPWIDANDNYDFNYQQQVILSEEVTLLPGDELLLECVYDSSDRDFTTYGGEGTYEEMCLVYLTVYPKPDLDYCLTMFSNPQVYEWETKAEDKGFYDSSGEYDVSVNGAIEHYEDLWESEEYQNRIQLCTDPSGEVLYYGFSDPMPTIEEYYDSNTGCWDDYASKDGAQTIHVFLPLTLITLFIHALM